MNSGQDTPGDSILVFGGQHILNEVPNGDQATTNVLLLKFDHLAKESAVRTGDPISCANCGAILNSHSRLEKDGENYRWACEFCGEQNSIQLEVEEIPKVEPMDFVYGNLPPAESEPAKEEEKDESIVVFCIDTSGSMSMTTGVKGGSVYKNLGAKSLLASQRDKKEEEEVWVSRLEFVQSAVDAQLESMRQETPLRRVGIVTFSGSVIVYDDSGKPHEIKGPMLNDYSGLLEKGSSFTLERTIAETRDELGRTVRGLNDGGATALGPALLLSVSMASQRPGSKVIICTDGLANVGVGDLTGASVGDFYEQVAQYAKRKGVVLSVISIKGADTRLEKLGALADITTGTVHLVNPNSLDFSNLISTKSLATNCVVTLYLHPALRFVNEENEGGQAVTGKGGKPFTKLVRDIGIVASGHQVAFEFAPVSHDAQLGSSIPFQVQMSFTKLNGIECKRVVTVTKGVTTDRKVAQQELDICVISANLAQQSARMARAGNYEAALDNAKKVRALIAGKVQTEQDKRLFDIFTQEYEDITEVMQNAIDQERDEGARSAFARTENRSDRVAHKLYSHKAAKSEACLVQ